MNKYIDADLLRKKVQEQINYAKGVYPKGSMEAERSTAIIAVCLDILASIDSLQQEQPEVDLEKHIENEINHHGLSLYEASYGTFSASQIDRIIRNAFELGKNSK